MVEEVIRLEAWDGYLVKRWEYPATFFDMPRAIEDGTTTPNQESITRCRAVLDTV